MKKNKKMYVWKFVPYHKKRQEHKLLIIKFVALVSIVCITLILTTVYAARKIPVDFYKTAMKTFSENRENDKKEVYICNNPQPNEETQKKASRLKEIILEDWNEHNYTPARSEMNNVYVFDNKKICYLTFDDGPSSVTPEILNVLKTYKVKATFFVTGKQAKNNPEILKQIYKDGHSIGNHSYSHVYDSIYFSGDSFKDEVLNCKNAINKALGFEYKNLIFRFPGGYTSLNDENTKKIYCDVLEETGYKFIDWSCLTGDGNTTEPTADYLLNTLLYGIGNSKTGDIVVLMHDSSTKKITAEVLPQIIEYINSNGYKFAALKN